ncbi:hypothetical protein KIPB_008176 [Kipferlia bialata]|uniref:Uncharacterized protein n=1 Tax=Kipferlia bialata TaxID=797122 RepID=A0A9K3GKM1_9EUKA|nr:hypothetical protein KIPB_008176 [Kipferlia bialata]|eukprot:g8176.t1
MGADEVCAQPIITGYCVDYEKALEVIPGLRQALVKLLCDVEDENYIEDLGINYETEDKWRTESVIKDVELSVDYTVSFFPPMYDRDYDGHNGDVLFKNMIFFHGFTMNPPEVWVYGGYSMSHKTSAKQGGPDLVQAAEDMRMLCSTLSSLGLDPQPYTYGSI